MASLERELSSYQSERRRKHKTVANHDKLSFIIRLKIGGL